MMGCGCGLHKSQDDGAPRPKMTLPTEQCLKCAQKHFDEAWICLNEYAYTRDNQRYIRGSLRAIVLHTGTMWPVLAQKARELALSFQDGRCILEGMKALGDMIDDAFDDEYPEISARKEENFGSAYTYTAGDGLQERQRRTEDTPTVD